jgi:hypothetical protein
MLVFLNRKRFESSLIQAAVGMIMAMVSTNVGILQPMHESAPFTNLARPKDEMEMIGHQAIGEHRDWYLLVRVAKGLEKCLVIGVFEENLAARVARPACA